jgi:RNA polymerase sigma-70 factor (ECF subfamily)
MSGPNIASTSPVASTEERIERLASLFDAHYRRLYCLARRLTNSADDANDLVQETFLRAATPHTSIPYGATSEEAWLVRVLINIRRDQWRKESVREKYTRVYRRGSSMGQDPEKVLIAKTAVWQSLDFLPPRRRAIVVMHEVEGLDVAAIAVLLGISAITVRWHLSMGRRELVRVLRLDLGGGDGKT